MAEKGKLVYFFGDGKTEGNGSMRDLLGGKGANLAEMANLGLPVPPGFTITTEACTFYQKNGEFPPQLKRQVTDAIQKLEEVTGKVFGGKENPLLVSVRSGARVSMPGMMDTVLNLGLNDETVLGLASKDERFAYDCYRRFISMFGDVVLGMEFRDFEELLEAKKKETGVENDAQLTPGALKQLVGEYKELVKAKTGKPFPQSPKEQLWLAIAAVFDSWNTARAVTYRKLNNIPDEWGTAVNVQTMVFGNLDDNSGTGVAFTRDPATGEKRFFGEYLIKAQGEDVVAGIRTPEPIETLRERMPQIYQQLEEAYQKLERHLKDMQDIEFTIENGRLYILQTRNGKRTAQAAVKIAVDMANEGLIDKKTALKRVSPEQLEMLLHPTIDPSEKPRNIAKGLPASPGAAVGKVVFTPEKAEELAAAGEKAILVRTETSPEDIGGMHAAEGILTVRGGMTSHAAVVARGMGKCCVAGCGSIVVNEKEGYFSVNGVTVREGDYITLDGTTGTVMLGKAKLKKADLSGEFAVLLSWADEYRRLGVRTNADTPGDAKTAREFGAQGIGLCRTEHMFFGEDRIPAVREMIMAEDEESRKKALEKLLPMQKEDFKGIFKAMDGLPVTIRLLDPPLHEFLPNHEELVVELAKLKASGGDKKRIAELERLLGRVEKLREFNPMLGHRGCRLGITYPEIYRMQAQAIFEAACELAQEGFTVKPEVMIPLVGHVREFELTKKEVDKVAREVMERTGVKLDYLVGTMIELPRAAITADQIAREAEFFSFGTNDLTQTTFGFSRDDAGTFLPYYVEHNILDSDPFIELDQEGVGELVKIGVQKGRNTRPELKIGICGEHGGNPPSIEFAHHAGLDYVSCSPYRVPIARMAAAHAALKEKE